MAVCAAACKTRLPPNASSLLSIPSPPTRRNSLIFFPLRSFRATLFPGGSDTIATSSFSGPGSPRWSKPTPLYQKPWACSKACVTRPGYPVRARTPAATAKAVAGGAMFEIIGKETCSTPPRARKTPSEETPPHLGRFLWPEILIAWRGFVRR